MDYSVQKGDCLWNIVKANYGYTDNTQIANKVNQIAKENNIKNANLIYIGQTIKILNEDEFQKSDETETGAETPEVTTPEDTGEPVEMSRADKFDEWTNSEENYQDFLDGGDGGEFQMFDLDLSTYSSDLKAFSQEYIDKFDADGDGKWNREEFITMALGGQEATDEMREMFGQAFDGLNLDDDAETISAEEFASQLYMTDLDLDNYASTGDVASSIDGKFTFADYQGMSSILPGMNGFDTLQNEKLSFFNHFYNKAS